jgi:hypothetical protein
MVRIHIEPDPDEVAVAKKVREIKGSISHQVILDEGVGRPEPELEPIDISRPAPFASRPTPFAPAIFWTPVMKHVTADNYGGSMTIEQNQCSACHAVVSDAEWQWEHRNAHAAWHEQQFIQQLKVADALAVLLAFAERNIQPGARQYGKTGTLGSLDQIRTHRQEFP